MTTGKPYLAWLAAIIALAIVLSAEALAAGGPSRITVAGTEDMRLWSFGDCDRRFPYVHTEEHKECVRVVGSAEAKDARALRVCEVSHQPNLDEIERCKRAYYANKEKAARDIAATHALVTAQAAASPETMRVVKAISSASVEDTRVLAASPAPAEAPRPAVADVASESSSPMPTIGLALLGMVAVGFGARNVIRKKKDDTAEG